MINYFRKENGWTMKEFGEKLGKSESAISKWIKGDRSPMVEDFNKMVNLFNTSPDILMYGATVSSSTLSEITRISSELDVARQEKVLDYTKEQREEQEVERRTNVIQLKKKKITDEELWDIVEHGVANDGSEQTEYEKQFFFNLLREHLDNDNDDEYED